MNLVDKNNGLFHISGQMWKFSLYAKQSLLAMGTKYVYHYAICMAVVSPLFTVAKYSAEIYLEIAKQHISASLEASLTLWLTSLKI